MTIRLLRELEVADLSGNIKASLCGSDGKISPADQTLGFDIGSGRSLGEKNETSENICQRRKSHEPSGAWKRGYDPLTIQTKAFLTKKSFRAM